MPAPPPTPTPYTLDPRQGLGKMNFTVAIDRDLIPFCEDQARNSAMSLSQWISVYCNEGLKLMLGM
jgi:hypothetical protein